MFAEPSPRTRDLLQRLNAFFDEHIYPNEARHHGLSVFSSKSYLPVKRGGLFSLNAACASRASSVFAMVAVMSCS